jgi:hypothetical protein
MDIPWRAKAGTKASRRPGREGTSDEEKPEMIGFRPVLIASDLLPAAPRQPRLRD